MDEYDEFFDERDDFDLYNASFRVFLDSFDRIADQLDENNAKILFEYYEFFSMTGPTKYVDFLGSLLDYIENDGNKSFEETYIIKDKANKLRKSLV